VFLSKTEIDALDLEIAHVHAATGVRVVAAEIGKADTYEDLPWKAFALSVAIALTTVVAGIVGFMIFVMRAAAGR
jgi:succinate dehydrogenase hydrophobic anchor subunit